MSHLNDIIKPSFSADSYPIIKKGSTGDVVKTWQAVVGVPIDGKFGPATEDATKKWQKDHNLKVDGIVGPLTWATMPNTKIVVTQEASMLGNKLWLQVKQLPLWLKVGAGVFLGGLFLITRKKNYVSSRNHQKY